MSRKALRAIISGLGIAIAFPMSVLAVNLMGTVKAFALEPAVIAPAVLWVLKRIDPSP
jgi:hypothetical protein